METEVKSKPNPIVVVPNLEEYYIDQATGQVRRKFPKPKRGKGGAK